MKVRRAYPDVFYEGINITKDIEKDLISFSYVDIASGAADTISLMIQDRDKKWLSSWAPDKGDTIQVKIWTENWREEGDNGILNCGTFIVDQPKYSGRPITLSLDAISMPNNNDFTTTEKSRTWDNATLEEIGRTISGNAGLDLVFDSAINPTIQFLEQSETSDKSFLSDLCGKYGVVMKLYSKKIILFDEALYESKDTVMDIDESDMENWDLTPSLTGTGYDGVSINYFDPETEKQHSYKYIIPGRSEDKILKLNDLVYSLAEAKIKAKGELRKTNKSETKLSITIAGKTNLISANTINITGLGKYSGKYYIDKISHKLKPYKLSVDLHKVLEGY